MKWLLVDQLFSLTGLLVSLSVFGVCFCCCYSSEEMEQSEDVLIFHIQSWKQSCKSVSTCNQKPETAMKLFDPSHLHLCQTLAPVFLKLFISRWYFRRHMFSRVGMRRVPCVPRERCLIDTSRFDTLVISPQAEAVDLRTVVRRGCVVMSLSVRWAIV